MEPSDLLRLTQQPPALRCLVIGGYAVAAHGHFRATFDLDLLVRRDDREAWFAKLAGAGLIAFASTAAFAQFSQPQEGDGLDLMFVDDVTFERMWDMSEPRILGDITARVPCLDHLLALKLHALKQSSTHRTSKDADDVEMLARRNRLDLREPRYEQLFLKYGNRELYETFLRLLRES